jgi:L-ascorbate metabolism protein UlaG (beta-lactamase superfamily)
MIKRPTLVLIALFAGVILLIFQTWIGAQTGPEFSGIRALTNKEVALTLTASNGVNHRIEASSNAAAWAGLVTLPGAGSSLQHTDSAAPYLRQRFYRAARLNGTNNLTGDHVNTTNGDVVIHPINHASFVMSWQGRMIYNDVVGSSTLYAGLPKADLILVSHAHTDHFSSTTIDAVRGTNAIIIAPQAVYNSLSTALRSNTIVLTNGASASVMGLTVDAVPAYNPTYHPVGTGNGYVLTIADKRLYMSGDTGDIPEMRALRNIDVAFVAMNLPYTMNYTNAASAVREFRPKVVYPYHYSPSTPTVTDLNDFKRRVGQDVGVEVRLRKWY